MTIRVTSFFLFFLTACAAESGQETGSFSSDDQATIVAMVNQREKAMVGRDIHTVTQQFDSNAHFINGGGYLYQGLSEIKDFHNQMFTNDSLAYTYKIGKVFIDPVQADVALVYYPWQQQWTLKHARSDTLNEVGLMTITAIKEQGQWKWKAVTNQRTKEYFEDLTKHKSKAIQ